jgi:hypothetical protein
MNKLFGIIFGMILVITPVKAANPVPYTFDVQGLILGNKYTDTQTRAKLGNIPLSFKTYDDGEVIGRTYQYGITSKYDVFRFGGEQDVITYFYLATSSYALFEGHIKVGDNISKFNQLGGGLRVLNEIVDNNHKIYHFYPIGFVSEVFLVINTDNDGKITSMWFEMPI